ncbi:MAG: NADH-quinone oxidoreductase subunit A [bacterium]
MLAMIMYGVAWFLRWRNPYPEKLSTYECGEDPFGTAWIRFNIRYYFFALLFVVFDVEIVFFFPWATAFNILRHPSHDISGQILTLGFSMFGEMMVFIFLLILGWAYAWRKGYLQWD